MLYSLYGFLEILYFFVDSFIFLEIEKLSQPLVPLDNIKFDVGLHFSKTDYAEMHGFFAGLFVMVAAVHEAVVEYAVSDSEHVGYFMGHHSQRAVFYFIVVDLVFLHLEETGVIAGEGEDSCAITDAGNAKDEIPLLSGVEVGHADSHHAEGIARQF